MHATFYNNIKSNILRTYYIYIYIFFFYRKGKKDDIMYINVTTVINTHIFTIQ